MEKNEKLFNLIKKINKTTSQFLSPPLLYTSLIMLHEIYRARNVSLLLITESLWTLAHSSGSQAGMAISEARFCDYPMIFFLDLDYLEPLSK